MLSSAFPFRGRRVLVVAAYDSFLRAAVFFARNLEAQGATVEYVLAKASKNQLSETQRKLSGLESAPRVLPLEEISKRSVLDGYDLVLLALDGARTRRFVHAAARGYERAPVPRPLTMSFYPGLLFRYHLEGMFSRMSCDLFLLNSRSDERLYRDAVRALGLSSDNGMLGGLSMLAPESVGDREVPEGGTILFVGQPTVPVWRHERLYLLDRLAQLATRFPNTQVVVKPRHRKGETTLHKEDHHFEDLLQELAQIRTIPPNLTIRYAAMSELLSQARVCLTVSSTAALEALALRIPTRIITDFGIHEHLGNHFFLGSETLCELDAVTPQAPYVVDPTWLANRACSTQDHLSEISARLQQLMDQRDRASSLSLPNRRLFGRPPAYDAFIREHFEEDDLTLVAERPKSRKRSWQRMRARLLRALTNIRNRQTGIVGRMRDAR